MRRFAKPTSPTVLAVSLAACLTAPLAPAAAAPASPHGHPARAAKAAVTDIREVVNQTSQYLTVHKGEGSQVFAQKTLDPNSRTTDSMWIPWVGNENEMDKSIDVNLGLTVPYWIFQDYWNGSNQIKFSKNHSYRDSVPVPGSNTGGGRKRLTIRPDGSPYLESIN
ncbi:hypothetical protein [Planotetraspora sp. GP83]|uniref:hypothetical protein n=1 Tax=Planotetraspora sp. GP83 TaxID=3156264 RepID=UPI0035146B2F